MCFSLRSPSLPDAFAKTAIFSIHQPLWQTRRDGEKYCHQNSLHNRIAEAYHRLILSRPNARAVSSVSVGSFVYCSIWLVFHFFSRFFIRFFVFSTCFFSCFFMILIRVTYRRVKWIVPNDFDNCIRRVHRSRIPVQDHPSGRPGSSWSTSAYESPRSDR